VEEKKTVYVSVHDESKRFEQFSQSQWRLIQSGAVIGVLECDLGGNWTGDVHLKFEGEQQNQELIYKTKTKEKFTFETFSSKTQGSFYDFLDNICSGEAFSSVEDKTWCFEKTIEKTNCYVCTKQYQQGSFCRKSHPDSQDSRQKLCLFKHTTCGCAIKTPDYLCLKQLFEVCWRVLSLPKSLGILV
jgi:hypothetical protein